MRRNPRLRVRALRRIVLSGLLGVLTLGPAAAPLSAHHGVGAKFDPDRMTTLNGRVAHVDWSNPHAHVVMVVEDGGRARTWYVELESPVLLERNGWTQDTLRPGDFIMVQGPAARDGSPQVWSDSLRTASGEAVLTPAPWPPEETRPPRPTPRWPDGQPRLGPPPGESGYWVPVAPAMMENGAGVEMDAHGRLRDPADAGRVAPFQEWARHLYEHRQRDFLRSDPMFLDCKPLGGARQFQSPFGVQFLEDRLLDRIFVLAGGGNFEWRFIYTDGRPHDGGFDVEDGNLLYYGRAVAAWDDDTMIVDSRGFNEKFWFAHGGLPHTEQLRLIERISRPDFYTLTYEVTVEDPGAYTRPWTSSWTLRWVEGDPPEYYCQDVRQ